MYTSKYTKILILAMMFVFAFFATGTFAEDTFEPAKTDLEPFSEEFLRWQSEQNSPVITRDRATANSDSESDPGSESENLKPTGYIPIPIDLSHLADNPPQEISMRDKATTIPSKYDLRTAGNYLTSVKDQGDDGTCWAFAGIGAMESNYMRQGNSKMDLSVMHLAWFAMKNSDYSKAYENYKTNSNMNTILGNGGNSLYTIALYSRLDGPVLDSVLPYRTAPAYSTPESYPRVLRLKEATFTTNSRAVDSSENIKQRIMTHGAVQISYYGSAYSSYAKINGHTTFYNSANRIDHAVLLVGWDDDFPKEDFKNKPSSNGAWLVKNSWGDIWGTNGNGNVGDNGYFWMSYEQLISDGCAFIVEPANSDMQCYYYDALGWVGTVSYKFAANVFQALRDKNEKLTEVGLFTTNNNVTCKINVYTGLKSVNSAPTSGNLVHAQNETISTAGYHTITLHKQIPLTKGDYFSVVVQFSNSQTAVESKISGYTDNAEIESGSFFSDYGSNSSWSKGNSYNACIKAFTVTGGTSPVVPMNQEASAPVINTTTLSDGILGESYSEQLSISGTNLTFTTRNLPNGLSFNSNTLTISGKPTKTGTFTTTITAKNSYGSATKQFTITIYEKPALSTSSLPDATTDTKYYAKLTAKGSANIIWTASGLPDTLTFTQQNSAGTSATIEGTPTEVATYNVTLKLSNDVGIVTKNLTLKVNGVAPKITAKLPNGIAEREYSASEISASGTKPISFDCTITPTAEMKKANILTLEDLGLKLEQDSESGTANITGTPNFAFKSLPVNITAKNVVSKATSTVKFTVEGEKPAFTTPDESETQYTFNTGSDIDLDFEVTGTKVITFTATGYSPLTFSQTGDKTAKLSGKAPTSAKTLSVTVKAANASGTATKKITLNIIEPPTITTTSLASAKTDTKYSVKLSAKGSVNISWDVSGLPDTLSLTQNTNGTSATLSGTPTEIGTYNLTFTATNTAGTTTKNLSLKVEGVAPSLSLSFGKGAVDQEYSGSKISATGTKPINFTCTLTPTTEMKANGISTLKDLGLELEQYPDSGTAKITGTPIYAISDLVLNVTASNDVSKQSKSAKLTVTGAKPAFTAPTESSYTYVASSDIDLDFKVTGTNFITFKSSGHGNLTFTQDGEKTARLYGKAPTTAQTLKISVTATNASGSASKKITLDIIEPPKITTTSLNNAKTDAKYSVKLAAKGTGITWGVSGLPDTLTLTQNATGTSATISGTPTEIGTYNVTFTVTNAAGSTSRNLTLKVEGVAPSLSLSFGKGAVDQEYSGSKISATGTKPINFTCAFTPTTEMKANGISTLEDLGLKLEQDSDSGTAKITGTPKYAFTNLLLSITASNDVSKQNKTAKFTVTGAKPAFTAPTESSYTYVASSSAGSNSSGFLPTESNYTYVASSDISIDFAVTGTDFITFKSSGHGNLTFTQDGKTARLSGKAPTSAQTMKVTVTATNSSGSASKKITLNIIEPPTITTTSLKNATTDAKYSVKLSAKGATGITWDVSGLPDTLTLTQNSMGTSATISGTPTEIGSYDVTFTTTNAAGTTSKTLNLTVKGVAPNLTFSLAKGKVDQEYSGSKISATGTKPITFAYTFTPTTDMTKNNITKLEDLGLSFEPDPDSGTAKIIGTPKYSFANLPVNVTAENAVSKANKSAKFTVNGTKPVFQNLSTTSYTQAAGTSVDLDFEVTGTDFITFSASGQGNLTLTQTDTHRAKLSGTLPTTEQKLTVTVTAANSDGTASKKITIISKVAPKITTATLTPATLDNSYKQQLAATGSTKITWSVDGDLPDGMSFNASSGTLSGTPTEDGTFDLTFTATNEVGTDSKTLSLTVGDATTAAKPKLESEAAKTESELEFESESESEAESESESLEDISGIEFANDASSSQESEFESGFESVSSGDVMIAAILPEILITEDNVYEFTVKFGDDVPENAKLIWSEDSGESELVGFYESSDQSLDNAIETVPESREIIVAVWLKAREEKYSPMILAESPEQ